MHWFNTVAVFSLVTLLGVEFSVSAFTNPAVWRLEPDAQWKMLSRMAAVFGKAMPVWYLGSTLLVGVETWLYRRAPERSILLAVDAIMILIAVASVFVLVPLNNRVAEGAGDWQRSHRRWDRIHRARIGALAVGAFLLTYAVTR